MIWISIILLAIAVSFDSLAMGITYGMNRVTIPLCSKVVLSIVSGLSVMISMTLGQILEQKISSSLANNIGGIIFIFIGLYHLWSAYRPEDSRILIDWHIPGFGLIIKICQKPLLADRDQSKNISSKEAIMLGIALALDAIAAGFGAAMISLPILSTTLAVIIACYFFISQGLKTGNSLVISFKPKASLSWLPGMIILCIGLLKIIVG